MVSRLPRVKTSGKGNSLPHEKPPPGSVSEGPVDTWFDMMGNEHLIHEVRYNYRLHKLGISEPHPPVGHPT